MLWCKYNKLCIVAMLWSCDVSAPWDYINYDVYPSNPKCRIPGLVFISFCLHTFSWLCLKLLPSTEKNFTRSHFFLVFFIFIAHFLLRACAKFTSFINLVHLITCLSLRLFQLNICQHFSYAYSTCQTVFRLKE